MYEVTLTHEQRELRHQVRDFVRWVPRDLLLAMDADQIRYPHEYVQEAARLNLLGLRFSPEYGGQGLTWRDEIVALEEIGVLGASLACLYSLVSIVGEALEAFGTSAQKERYLAPPPARRDHLRRGAHRTPRRFRFFRRHRHRPARR